MMIMMIVDDDYKDMAYIYIISYTYITCVCLYILMVMIELDDDNLDLVLISLYKWLFKLPTVKFNLVRIITISLYS